MGKVFLLLTLAVVAVVKAASVDVVDGVTSKSVDVDVAAAVAKVEVKKDDVKKEDATLKDLVDGVDNSTNANSRRWAPYPGPSQPQQPEYSPQQKPQQPTYAPASRPQQPQQPQQPSYSPAPRPQQPQQPQQPSYTPAPRPQQPQQPNLGGFGQQQSFPSAPANHNLRPSQPIQPLNTVPASFWNPDMWASMPIALPTGTCRLNKTSCCCCTIGHNCYYRWYSR